MNKITHMEDMMCRVLGVDFKRMDLATNKTGYVQQVRVDEEDVTPLIWSTVHVDRCLMPAQGVRQDKKDGSFKYGVSRVLRDSTQTYPYYSLVAAVADMSRKTETLERLLREASPELAAKYAEMFPKGIPTVHEPMIPEQGDGNEDFRNVSSFHWRNFGEQAHNESEQIRERDEERYVELAGGGGQEKDDNRTFVAAAKSSGNKKKKNKKQQRKRKERTPEPEPDVEVDADKEERFVIPKKVPRGGRVSREVLSLLQSTLDGPVWSGKRPAISYSRSSASSSSSSASNDEDDQDEEREEQEQSEVFTDPNFVIDLGDDVQLAQDDGDVQPMMCSDLADVVLIPSETDEEMEEKKNGEMVVESALSDGELPMLMMMDDDDAKYAFDNLNIDVDDFFGGGGSGLLAKHHRHHQYDFKMMDLTSDLLPQEAGLYFENQDSILDIPDTLFGDAF